MTEQVYSKIVKGTIKPKLAQPNTHLSNQSGFASVDFNSVKEYKWLESNTHGNPEWRKGFVDTLMISLSDLKTQLDKDPDSQRPRAYSPWPRSRDPQTPDPGLSPLQELASADMALLFGPGGTLAQYGLTGDYTTSPSTEGSSSSFLALGDAQLAALFGSVSAGYRALHRYVGHHTPTLVRV